MSLELCHRKSRKPNVEDDDLWQIFAAGTESRLCEPFAAGDSVWEAFEVTNVRADWHEPWRALLQSIMIVAMYLGSCLFHPKRRSGLSGCGLSYMIVLCSLSRRSNTRTLPGRGEDSTISW